MSLAALARSLRGALVAPGAPGYDGARRVWNAGGRPALIVRAADAADVERAVAYARAEGRSVAIRGGGHSIAGFGMPDEAVAIDLRALAAIEVAGDEVTVGGGATWGAVLERLEPLGRAFPGGFDARVGVAGLTLGGGYGLLTRALGLAADSLAGAEVVGADGVRADADAELLWALRGAGANFGVATRLRFRLHPVPPVVAGVLVHPLDLGVLRAVRDLAGGAPDSLTVYVGVSAAGTIELRLFHLGTVDDARRCFAPFGRVGAPLRSQAGLTSHRALCAANPVTFPDGEEHAWRADFVRRLDDGVLELVVEHARRALGQRLWIVLEHLGGAVARVAPDATAFAHRDAGWGVASATFGQPRCAALDELHDALAPFAIGRYVNYATGGAAAAYGANLPRLRALKLARDPDNRFRHNVNLLQA